MGTPQNRFLGMPTEWKAQKHVFSVSPFDGHNAKTHIAL